VQTAIIESESIPDITSKIDDLTNKITYSSSIYNKNSYNTLVSELGTAESDLGDAIKKESSIKYELSKINSEYQAVKWNLDKYIDLLAKAEEQKEIVKANKELNEQIVIIESELSDTESEINEIESTLSKLRPRLIIAQKTKTDVEKSIDRLIELEQSYTGYEYYLKAVKRDGVPYDLITKALPQIEAEVNNILTQIVEFTILLNTDGKNINAYIVYDTDNYWPLELTSGMEKFISSLAIRASLIHVSSLPRPNFIAIDEGFGNLDSDNLNSMYMLFDYLKSQFGFILSISHIDAMRDIVDSLIEIKKESGYSKISYD
jgi:DNA repair exonuclease SbcCD ATPase subunit